MEGQSRLLGVGKNDEAVLSEFFAMGGYAAYVWPAFGVALILMAGLFWQSVVAARRSAAEFESLRAERRPRSAGPRRPMRAKRAADMTASTESPGD